MTYFAEIEHLLPGAQMQPIWEMAKKKDSTGKWVNDFGLSYHRGIYQKDYDDYHDIYLQRWRLEDKPWKVWCVERANPGNRYLVPRGHSTGENYALCPDPEFYKVVEGQGYQPEERARFDAFVQASGYSNAAEVEAFVDLLFDDQSSWTSRTRSGPTRKSPVRSESTAQGWPRHDSCLGAPVTGCLRG